MTIDVTLDAAPGVVLARTRVRRSPLRPVLGRDVARFYTTIKSLTPLPQRKQQLIDEDYDDAWRYVTGAPHGPTAHQP